MSSAAVSETISTVVNDMSIHVATANGSGSQTSNMVLLRALFQMGIPVSGKNLFPSNIQGLPTWFTIRASKDGWIARKADTDVIVCMNAETAEEDIASARTGAVLIYEDSLRLQDKRPDCVHYPVPFKKLIAESCPDLKLRKLVINMLYVGVCAQLFGIDMDEIKRALNKQLAGKQKAIDINLPALEHGAKWAAENLPKKDPFRLERMDANQGKVIIEGNAAAALGLMFGGVTVVTWYPITPSSSLCEYLDEYLNRFRLTPDGKRTFAVVQAEDEIAAVGMLAGAGWAGARAFTSTSGPGISLMNEIIGLGYFAEIPFVICDVARTGPSTGLPTRTMQGDIYSLMYASHGDTKHIVLIPSEPKETFEFAQESLDIAEEFQTPVFLMLDLDLGMNYWMADRFQYPGKAVHRGKVLSREQLEALGGKWGRYQDVDGDGVAWRTIPGTEHPAAAYFTRGTGHTPQATYSEKPEHWKSNMDRLARKFDSARKRVPKPVISGEGSKVGLLFFGTTTEAVREADASLRKHGQKVDLCRLRAFPFTQEVESFIDSHERVYVVEVNRDGQMRMALSAELPKLAHKLRGILHYDGMPITAADIVTQFREQEAAWGNGTPE